MSARQRAHLGFRRGVTIHSLSIQVLKPLSSAESLVHIRTIETQLRPNRTGISDNS